MEKCNTGVEKKSVENSQTDDKKTNQAENQRDSLIRATFMSADVSLPWQNFHYSSLSISSSAPV